METRDLWEDQVNRLTKTYKATLDKIESVEGRMDYVEGLLLNLIIALKEAGVIVPATDAEE
tara:strand:- start:3808 stop:3990 length:183 start_codon:yes stop_codon:yes gene_type:complete